jgi:hypothetical protein
VPFLPDFTEDEDRGIIIFGGSGTEQGMEWLLRASAPIFIRDDVQNTKFY